MLEYFLGFLSGIGKDWLIHTEPAKHLRDEIARIMFAVRKEAGDAVKINSGATHGRAIKDDSNEERCMRGE